MLIAEIHGKYVSEALTSEDYLTSAVFGHLRYVLPVEGQEVNAAATVAASTGEAIADYDRLEVIFWPSHPEGEPDVLLLFRTESALTFAVFVEVKLDAGKSGAGENDQLARYLRIADSLDRLTPRIGPVAGSLLIFLTPATNPSELLESLGVYGDTPFSRSRLYRLDWQDIISAAEAALGRSDMRSQSVLRDVADFLRKRNLEHFSGMSVRANVPWFDVSDGPLFRSDGLFSAPEVLDGIDLVKGDWT
jgi:hypothetical protein